MNKIIAVVTDARMDTERRKYRFDPLYSGGAAFIDGFDCPVYIDLATLRVDPAPKALLDHDMERVVGYLENIENDGTSVSCDVIVGGTKDAAAVFDYEENVAPFVCSIGVYRIEDKDIEFVDEGVRAKVNGREITGRAAIIHGGSLAEGSFVSIGGDGDARVVRARLTFKNGVVRMDEREKEELDDAVLEEDRAAADIEEAVDAAVDEKVDEKVDELTVEAVEEILADDATREDLVAEVVDVAAEKLEAEDFGVPVEEIKEEVIEELVDEKVVEEKEVIARAAKKAVAKIKKRLAAKKARRAELRALAKKSPRLASLAVAKGWTMDEANRKYAKLKALRNLPSLHALKKDAPRPQDVLAASLAITLGMSPDRAKNAFKCDERVIDAALSKEHRGATLKTVVAACNNSHKAGSFGVNTNMLDAWGDARRYSRSVKASAGFSTINALDVFSNVLQAFLEPSEETAERVWTYVSRTNTLADFNAVPSYLPTLQGRLREISETGAISNITFTTERFENATKANGVNFTIPEMVIINDQIDVFAELLRQFETLGDDCIEHDVAEMFWRIIDGDAKDASGASIVSAARGNLITGGLDEDGLNDALTALASFSNANGTPLRIDRARLLSPMKYAANALKIYNQEYVQLDGGIATPNIWKGRFEPFIWQYLDAAHARATKDDGTTASLLVNGVWTLIRDPQTRPVVCVNKLVGYESPQVRTFDYDPNVWGLTYQMIYPYSVSTQYADGIVVVKPE